MLVVDKENFEAEVINSAVPVIVDIWGPKCGPCLALMPHVEALAADYEEKIKFCKLNAAENRRLLISLRVMSLPTFLFYKGGERLQMVTGGETTIEQIRDGAEKLLA